MDIVGYSLFGFRFLRFALNIQFHAPPSELSSHDRTRVTLIFASKGEAKERRRMLRLDRNFPLLCQNDDLLAHDIYIDKPKVWCQQKRARSYVGFRTE